MCNTKEAIKLVKAARHVFTYITLNSDTSLTTGKGRAVKTVKSAVLEALKSCAKTEKFDFERVNNLDNGFDFERVNNLDNGFDLYMS